MLVDDWYQTKGKHYLQGKPGVMRNLRLLVEKLRGYWIQRKAWHAQQCFLLDTKPVPVLSYKRSQHQRHFLGRADYGHCASRNLSYSGFKLVTISTLSGDQGFIGLDWQAQIVEVSSVSQVHFTSVVEYFR